MLLNEMEIFYHVVTQGSLSQAAERLGVSKSYVSKKITKLETSLNSRLIQRSTRQLLLTQTGEQFFKACEKVVFEGEKGFAGINALQDEPSGILKLSIPPALGVHYLAPMLTQYQKTYPNVILDIHLESHLVDLVKQGYDIALRSAKLMDSNLIAQRVMSVENLLCATSIYLKQHGTPQKPNELTSHQLGLYNQSKSMGILHFKKTQQDFTVRVQGYVMANQLELIKQFVLNHQAMAVLPEYMITDELNNGSVSHCLPDYRLQPSPIYAIYPEREFMLPKVSAFLQMIKKL